MMAIGPILAELWPSITQQQGQRVVAAFVATQGPPPEGMANGAFAEACLRRFIKAVVKGADRAAKEAELSASNAEVDRDLGD